MWSKWVIDGTFGKPFCFCPIEGDEVVIGMNLITDKPNGKLVGVIHSDGNEAANAFYEANKAEIDAIRLACELLHPDAA